MRHVLSATVQNVPGVLAHVSGMLASRGYNIDSLAVGETEDPRFSRMTFVLRGDDRVLDQVRRQLEKIVTVVRVDDISSRFRHQNLAVAAGPIRAAEASVAKSDVSSLDYDKQGKDRQDERKGAVGLKHLQSPDG